MQQPRETLVGAMNAVYVFNTQEEAENYLEYMKNLITQYPDSQKHFTELTKIRSVGQIPKGDGYSFAIRKLEGKLFAYLEQLRAAQESNQEAPLPSLDTDKITKISQDRSGKHYLNFQYLNEAQAFIALLKSYPDLRAKFPDLAFADLTPSEWRERRRTSYNIPITNKALKQLAEFSHEFAQSATYQSIHGSPSQPPPRYDATVHHYGKGGSVIAGMKGFNVRDPATRDRATDTRKNIITRLVKKDEVPVDIHDSTSQNKQTVRVAYDPSHISKEEVLHTLHTKTKADELRSKGQNQAFVGKTKYRSVSSFVTVYGDQATGRVYDNPFRMYMSTGCGINLWNRENEIREYLVDVKERKTVHGPAFTEGKIKAPEKYKATVKDILWNLMHEQDRAGVQYSMVPLIGAGLFMAALDENNKELAREIFFTALKEVIQEGEWIHLQEVILVAPDLDDKVGSNEPGRDAAFKSAEKVFTGYDNTTGAPNVTLANVDMLEATKHIHEQHPKAIIGGINAGSDRTIGGAYNPGKGRYALEATTLEETLSLLTDMVFVQALEFNERNLTRNIVIYDHPKVAQAAVDDSLNETATEMKTTKEPAPPQPAQPERQATTTHTNENVNNLIDKLIIDQKALPEKTKGHVFKAKHVGLRDTYIGQLNSLKKNVNIDDKMTQLTNLTNQYLMDLAQGKSQRYLQKTLEFFGSQITESKRKQMWDAAKKSSDHDIPKISNEDLETKLEALQQEQEKQSPLS